MSKAELLLFPKEEWVMIDRMNMNKQFIITKSFIQNFTDVVECILTFQPTFPWFPAFIHTFLNYWLYWRIITIYPSLPRFPHKLRFPRLIGQKGTHLPENMLQIHEIILFLHPLILKLKDPRFLLLRSHILLSIGCLILNTGERLPYGWLIIEFAGLRSCKFIDDFLSIG